MTADLTDRLLRRADVEARVGLARTTIYRKMSDGSFPRPVRVGAHAVRWSAAEIEEWLAECPRGPDPTNKPAQLPA